MAGSEVIRPLPILEPGIYMSDVSVAPGEEVSAHVSSPSSYETAIFKLGPETIRLSPEDARRELSAPLARQVGERAAANPIRPGSYMLVEGVPPAGPVITVGAWVRPWRLPSLDVVQWAWSGVISDFDYPHRCRFALLLDHAGRLGLYAGGGTFDHANLLLAETDLGSRMGQWIHLVGAVSEDGTGRIYVDGEAVAEDGSFEVAATEGSQVRIGATAEAGQVDGFLDADITSPFIIEAELDDTSIRRLADDRALSPLEDLVPPDTPIWGYWPFTDRSNLGADLSGHARHGNLVNCPVTSIGGPASDPSEGGPEYDPDADPNRGNAIRFASDDLTDADWPAALTWRVPDDSPSGIYAARLRLDGQSIDDAIHVPFVVSRRRPQAADSVALLCATNTWLAYGRRPAATRVVSGMTSSFYSVHHSGNPFFHVGFRLPLPHLDPFVFESARAARMKSSHLVRPELAALSWLEERQVPYEVITDSDLHAEPELLDRFRALFIAGHNEYWTDEMWRGIDDYLRRDGRVVSLSGNTGCWRVTLDLEARIIESRKVVDHHDDRWLSPANWGERWHCHGGGAGGQFVLLDRPAYRVLGVDTQGMIDDGTPTAFAGFEVVESDHFLFQSPGRVPIPSDAVIGTSSVTGPAASGYEFDVTAKRLGLEQELPPGLVVLASAFGQRNLEWNGVETDHGGDIVYWERPQGGRVFAIGSIAATGALLTDESIDALVGNVLHEFGVPVGN